MGGIASILEWATNTLQGVAFIELLIAIGMCLMYRKMHKIEQRIDDHEKGCNARHEADAKWKGSVDTKLEQLQKDVDK